MLKFIIHLGLLTTLAFSLVACNKSNSLDPTDAASHVYKKVLENDDIRMLVATLPAGEKEPRPHAHPKHAIYVIVGGELTQYPVEGSPEKVTLKTGEAEFMDATTTPYYNENTGTTTIQWLVVEFKKEENQE